MTGHVLADLRQRQAAHLASFDVFWVCAALAALGLLVPLMKHSVAEKRAQT